MHLFGVAFILSGILFAIFKEQTLILYFLIVVGGYLVISNILPGAKNIGNRKKFMVASWSNPSEGVIHVRVPCRTQKVQAILKNNTSNEKLTLTHFVIKAAAQMVTGGKDLSGKLVFGKFVPHKSIDISCLVDIEGGKDLAMLLIENVDQKSVKEIAAFIKEKGSKIKSGGGDKDHKKRTKSADFFPAFLVQFMVQVARFLTNRLGLSIPALALKRHQFGTGCVTSIGMLGFEDATAPFCPFMDCTFFISANAVHEAPVIENGKIQIGRVMNCNFVVDHRYIDGGKAKSFIKLFTQVFDEPEIFVDSKGPQNLSQSQHKPEAHENKQKKLQ